MESGFILSNGRRNFIKNNFLMLAGIAFPFDALNSLKEKRMTNQPEFDVIIIGGSYSGLAAAMALGRALRKVLIIDSGEPCNIQTPYSHNFLTQDGKKPREILMVAKQQVETYPSIKFITELATKGVKTDQGFKIQVAAGQTYGATKLIFATGIKDLMPDIKGFSECWGISVLHCPYCHGYEVRDQQTGILGNGEYGYEFCVLISNWTKDLTLFTNGKSTLTAEQTVKLKKHKVNIVEKEIEKLEHTNGHLQSIIFNDHSTSNAKAIYTRVPSIQHCTIPESLGCELTSDEYIKVDSSQKTNVHGVFACGDNTTRVRTVANAVAMGTTAGMIVNKEITLEEFQSS
jgi:thioredoxin reductase